MLRSMRIRSVDTRWLTQARFEPSTRQGRTPWRPLAGAAVLLLLLVAAGSGFLGDLFATSADLASAREEQAALAAENARLRTQLAVERATRAELEQQAAGLNAQVAELTRQVQFLTERRGAGARPN